MNDYHLPRADRRPATFLIRFWNSYAKSIPYPSARVGIGGVVASSSCALFVVASRVIVPSPFSGSPAVAMVWRPRERRRSRTASLMGPGPAYVTGVFIYGTCSPAGLRFDDRAVSDHSFMSAALSSVRGFAVALIGGLGNGAGAVALGLVLGLMDGPQRCVRPARMDGTTPSR